MGYCERCGGRFDFEGICETCGEDEEWSYNYPHNKNKVKCENCGTEIYETRRYCYVCGAKNKAAFKKGDYYCPHCGNAFEDGVCPECGKNLSHFLSRSIEPEDSGYCPECGKETSFKDHFCMNCGNENYIFSPIKKSSANKPKSSEYTNTNAQSNREPVKYYSDHSEEEKHSTSGVNSTLWLILGILQTVLCCMPTGIVTLIYSIQASNCAREDMMKRAERKLKTAKIWFFAGITIDVLLMLVSAIIQIL